MTDAVYDCYENALIFNPAAALTRQSIIRQNSKALSPAATRSPTASGWAFASAFARVTTMGMPVRLSSGTQTDIVKRWLPSAICRSIKSSRITGARMRRRN